MRMVFDLEANGLKPTKVWVIVCKDIDSGEYRIFRRPSDDEVERLAFKEYIESATRIIGHNILGYDLPVCSSLLGIVLPNLELCIDTLVVSKLVDYSRKGGHSIEDYGQEFSLPKGIYSDWSKYTPEMEKYCVRDVDICERIYSHYSSIIDDMAWHQAIDVEQCFQLVANDLHNNGFCFDVDSANTLVTKVTKELAKLDEAIHASFPPRLKLVREINPILTKYGTLHKKDFRWVIDGDLSGFNGGSFCRCEYADFNPASHKQVVGILHAAGWKPTERTATSLETKRNIARFERTGELPVDITSQQLYDKEQSEEKYGWKINETNLATLPPTAPSPAKSLARRILVESRRRVLTEWLGLVAPDNRIHGKFYSIGAWTHRMAHQAPNTANIPNAEDTQGKTRLYGAEMRSLWCAPERRLLVGVDAESIQLRIFAHYIDDAEFTEALINGRKEDKTDPHSLNQRVLGRVCKSRAAAKRFVYALLLGAGIGKLSEILECDKEQTQYALDRLLERYEGWKQIKKTIIPEDAARGYFIGLDGRKVRIHGHTESERSHLAMSGYLQNGEAVCMKHATLRWYKRLRELDIEFKLVNMVHDEWQTECQALDKAGKEDWNTAFTIAHEQAESLRWVGEKFGLKCPLAGSYMTDGKYTIGKNWKVTH